MAFLGVAGYLKNLEESEQSKALEESNKSDSSSSNPLNDYSKALLNYIKEESPAIYADMSDSMKQSLDSDYVPEYVNYDVHVQELNDAVKTAKEEGKTEAYNEIIEGTTVITGVPRENLCAVQGTTVLSGTVVLPDETVQIEKKNASGVSKSLLISAAFFVIKKLFLKGGSI